MKTCSNVPGAVISTIREAQCRNSLLLILPCALATAVLNACGSGEPPTDLADEAQPEPSGDQAASPAGPSETHPIATPIAPPAPLVDDAWRDVTRCEDEHCQGIEPVARHQTRNLVTTGMKHKGTNTQLVIPQNLQLADIDGNGISD